MTDTRSPDYVRAPAADFVLPFDLPHAGVRGRLVRLDDVSSRALSSHPLPEDASRVAGEALTLAAMLGSSLKLDGRLTLQLQGDGPLGLAVADYFPTGGLRGYARIDAERFAAREGPGFAELAGGGVLAITIEPAEGARNYQGIVALDPAGLAASAEDYFARSEQLPTAIRLAAGPIFEPGAGGVPRWRTGGLMLQVTPKAAGETDDEEWDRLALFLRTVEDLELLDTTIPAENLLWRLFHEEEVRVLPATALAFECRCGPEKVRAVLAAYPQGDLDGLADGDGLIRARCEFCGSIYSFMPAELRGP